MSDPAHPEALPPIGLLTELDSGVRHILAQAGRFETLPVETRLATQGSSHRTLSVLLSGKASAYCHANGDYVHVGDIKPGETIGEMNMLDPQRASADVTITEKAQVWIIEIEQFQAIVQQDPATAYTVLEWLARELCRRLRRNSDHMLRLAEERRSHMRDVDY